MNYVIWKSGEVLVADVVIEKITIISDLKMIFRKFPTFSNESLLIQDIRRVDPLDPVPKVVAQR